MGDGRGGRFAAPAVGVSYGARLQPGASAGYGARLRPLVTGAVRGARGAGASQLALLPPSLPLSLSAARVFPPRFRRGGGHRRGEGAGPLRSLVDASRVAPRAGRGERRNFGEEPERGRWSSPFTLRRWSWLKEPRISHRPCHLFF